MSKGKNRFQDVYRHKARYRVWEKSSGTFLKKRERRPLALCSGIESSSKSPGHTADIPNDLDSFLPNYFRYSILVSSALEQFAMRASRKRKLDPLVCLLGHEWTSSGMDQAPPGTFPYLVRISF